MFVMPNGCRGGWPKRPIPLGLLGALALIVVVERHIERHPLDYLGANHWPHRMASDMAEAGLESGQVLCFGDSLMQHGVAPKVVEAETNLQGYNFAVGGGQAPGSYFLLRRALDSGARPSAIVVDFFPRLLAEHPGFNNDNWPFLADLGDGLGLALLARKPAMFARFAVRLALPSARSRFAIRARIQGAFQPGPSSTRPEVFGSIRHRNLNRGAEITESRPGLVEDIDAWERGYFSSFHCSRINRSYVEKFLDLASSRQIPVFWLMPPYQPALQARCERSGFDAKHEAFVREFSTRYPGLSVLDARRSGYQPEVFHDLHHLGLEGALALSADVGEAIRLRRGEVDSRNRWVAMPGYRPRAGSSSPEDVEQSRMVVREETRPGRVTNPRR